MKKSGILYEDYFNYLDGKLTHRKTGDIYATAAGSDGWLCVKCKHYSKGFYELLRHCYKHLPESDGQAEQHLGAVTEVWWDEMTQTVRECLPNCNKYDNGKPRLDLVPPAIIEAVGEIRTYGVGKYGDSKSWHTVEPERYRASMMRHLCAYLRDPKSKDEESGLSHLAHLATNIAFLLELEREEK